MNIFIFVYAWLLYCYIVTFELKSVVISEVINKPFKVCLFAFVVILVLNFQCYAVQTALRDTSTGAWLLYCYIVNIAYILA